MLRRAATVTVGAAVLLTLVGASMDAVFRLGEQQARTGTLWRKSIGGLTGAARGQGRRRAA